MNKKLRNKIESLGWNIYECSKTSYELSQYSPAGEDFGFSISGNNDKELMQDIKDYYNYFDPEQHALMWVGSKGAPSLRILLNDADAIDEMLKKLVDALN
jgi:hypothetical protein